MIKFLIKGVFRDRSRSLLPVIVVSFGVFVLILLLSLMDGMMSNMVSTTANVSTGHLKVMTKAYFQEKDQNPLDLALLDVSSLTADLNHRFPDIEWTGRITFGVLLDVPGENGESLGQAPVTGMAYDLLGEHSLEAQRLGLERGIIEGKGIQHSGQILLSRDLAHQYDLHEGSIVTLFGSDMNGSMTFSNAEVGGIVSMGVSALDKGAVLMDLEDARRLLDMEDAVTTLLGFSRDGNYDRAFCDQACVDYNASADPEDPYAPVMISLREQDGMDEMLAYVDSMSGMMFALLLFALSLVLWNTGILGGIRRYGEFGVRMAIGEGKWHIFKTLMIESTVVGIVGSVIGTALGLLLSWYLQVHGIDYSAMLENVSMNIDPIVRTELSPKLLYIGFIPGVLSVMIGTALASRGIFKRKTADLYKELD